MNLFLKGLLVGFSIAAPVGPIGLLCLQRSLNSGRRAGLASGLGAASADAVYGALAAVGFGAAAGLLVEHLAWLRLGGGLFLLYLGVATWRASPPQTMARTDGGLRVGQAYLSTFFLTLTNPLTILSFIGIFAGLGLGPAASGGLWRAALLVLGVFLGSAGWWLFLSSAAGWAGARLQAGGLRTVNRLAGAILAGCGVWQLAGLIS